MRFTQTKQALLLLLPLVFALRERLDYKQVASTTEQLLQWDATQQPYQRGGKLGVQLEIGYSSWMTTKMIGPFLGTFQKTMVDNLSNAGIRAVVDVGGDFMPVSKGYILPIFVEVQGVSDIDTFNEKNLENTKVNLMDTMQKGSPGPGGVGFATDAESMEARMKKEYPEAVKSVQVRDAGRLQIELKLEFWLQPLQAKAGISSTSELAEMIWGNVTSTNWEKAHAKGIDLFVAGPAQSKESRTFTLREAKPFAEGGPAKCITPPDFAQIASGDNGKATLWEEGSDDKKVLGVRMVITLFSINELIESNFVAARNTVLLGLMEELPDKIQASKELCSFTPCGWSPMDPRAAPLPHDSVTCGPLPS